MEDNMKKRLLVVDLGYTQGQSVIGQFPESTELKVVYTLEEAHEEVRPKYGHTWEELWAQYRPNHAGGNTQWWHHFKIRREKLLQSRLPYWDAVLTYLWENDTDQIPVGFGIATIAVFSGAKYVGIMQRRSRKDSIFHWLPGLGFDNPSWLQIEERKVIVSNDQPYGKGRCEQWNDLLRTSVVSNEFPTDSYTNQRVKMEEMGGYEAAVNHYWPDLIKPK